MPELLARQYTRLKAAAAADLRAAAVARLISDMAVHAREILAHAGRIPLASQVLGKRYFSFRRNIQSRPINESLFAEQKREFGRLLHVFRRRFSGVGSGEIVRSVYSIAYSVFAANDISEVGRKASATFFEILVGHVVACALGVSPRRKVRVPETGGELTTDYVFDLGRNRRKLHLPVKTSTRERAVQAWVHQLVLERIFGAGRYRGALVVASETKQDARTGEVIEICVPKQLEMFQSRVAEMSRLYYLDPPKAYLTMEAERLQVRSFGEAPGDLRNLLGL